MEVKPKLLIIAGPNGSGKTSITSKILKHDWIEGCVYINPDEIARDIFGDWNSPEAVMKAAQYASEQREECIQKSKSLLFETVLSAPDKLEFIANCSQAAQIVDRMYVYDNSVDGVFPKLLFRTTDGKIKKVYTKVNSWAEDILQVLSE